MQPYHFFKMLEGYNWRQKNSNAQFAYFCSVIINHIQHDRKLDKNMTPKMILEPLEPKQAQPVTTRESLEKAFPKLKKGGTSNGQNNS